MLELNKIIECFKELLPYLAGLGIVIEITPIKINPVSWILNYIGKMINREICSEIKGLKEDFHELYTTVDMNEVDRIRYEILDFANSCRHGREHFKDEFTHIFEINDKYHAILKKRKQTNGVIDAEFEYIKKIYQEEFN